MVKNDIAFGVDIGGSHITVAPVDLASRKILPEGIVRGHVNSKGSVEEIIADWSAAIERSFAVFPDSDHKVGIAMPGPFDYEEGISLIKENNKYEALYGLSVRNLLAGRLGIPATSILFKNDAGCFLQGEAYAGAALGYDRAIAMTLGTGIGTAFMEDGVADDAALWCAPFMDGITEDYISTLWFHKRFASLGGDTAWSVKDMAEAFEGNELCRRVFAEFAENLATFVVDFARSRAPGVIVIGGNIMKSARLFVPVVEEKLRSAGITAPVRSAQLGEEAAVIGAASLQVVKEHSML